MLSAEQLRVFVLEYLRAAKNNWGQLSFQSCITGVVGIISERCQSELRGGQYLRDEDGARLKHVIWDLILERVLVPSTDKLNATADGWPHLSLTEHGKKVVTEQRPVPYDPDGYLSIVEKNSGGLHPTVKAYLAEAIATFRTNNLMASAVMLGAASEMMFTELCEAIARSLADPNHQSKFREKTAPKKNMADRVQVVSDWLSQKNNQLPADLSSPDRQRLIHDIAELIRSRRNEMGHPQDPPVTRSHEEVYALIMLFPQYCEKLYKLKGWLDSNHETIT